MNSKLLSTALGASLVAVSALTTSSPAKAASITLQTGDFLVLDITPRVSDTLALPPAGAINLVEFGFLDVVGNPTGVFAPAGSFGNARISASLLGGVSGVGVGQIGDIKSFDLATDFTVVGPLDTTFPLSNTFNPIAAFNPFFFLDVDGDSIDDLEFDLGQITATQQTALSTTFPTIVNVTGTGTLRSLNPLNSGFSQVAFTSAIIFDPSDGSWKSDGGLVVNVTRASVPEPGSVSAILSLGILGGGSMLKRRKGF
jgi:hypothetical protein